MTDAPFTITVYDGTVGDQVLDEVVTLYREVYAEPPYLEEDEEFTAFSSDLPRRVHQKSFRLVIARLGSEPVGFALGHGLPTRTGWWDGALTALSGNFTTEYPGRTFAIIELAVCKSQRRRQVGRGLHTHLTAGLTEERTTLLVRPDAEAAKAAYISWGYHKVGQSRPFEDAPVYDVMLISQQAIT